MSIADLETKLKLAKEHLAAVVDEKGKAEETLAKAHEEGANEIAARSILDRVEASVTKYQARIDQLEHQMKTLQSQARVSAHDRLLNNLGKQATRTKIFDDDHMLVEESDDEESDEEEEMADNEYNNYYH